MPVTGSDIRKKLDREITTVFKTWKSTGDSLPHPVKDVTYADFLSDKLLIIFAIKQGVPYSLFNLIQLYTPFSESDWANFLDMSAKSLQRYKQSSKRFRPIHSEKIIEMAEVTNLGLEVFGEAEKFRHWLNTPNFPLGNLKPLELLKDSYGKEMVMGELVRINHGILV